MTAEDFSAYLNENAMPMGPEYFQTVTLVSEENGFEIAFSDPTEEFLALYREDIETPISTLREGSVTLSGTILLDTEGRYKSTTLDIAYTTLYYGTQETPFHISVTSRYLSCDRPVTVMLPSRLEDYTEITDIRAMDLLEEAYRNQQSVYAGDFTEKYHFTGKIDETPLSLVRDYDCRFISDPAAMTVRSSSSTRIVGNVSNLGSHTAATSSYQDGVLTNTYENYGDETQSIDQETMLLLLQESFSSFAGGTFSANYQDYTFSGNDTTCIVTFTPDELITYYLFFYILSTLDYTPTESMMMVDDPTFEVCEGKLTIDRESRTILSVTLNITASFPLSEESAYSGTLFLDQKFHAINGDVAFEPGEGTSQAT